MNINNTLIEDLTQLRDSCSQFLSSKDRDQAYSVIYDNVKQLGTQEVIRTKEEDENISEHVASFVNKLLSMINNIKKMEDFSMQKAIAKIELADEIISKASLEIERRQLENQLDDEEDPQQLDE